MTSKRFRYVILVSGVPNVIRIRRILKHVLQERLMLVNHFKQAVHLWNFSDPTIRNRINQKE